MFFIIPKKTNLSTLKNNNLTFGGIYCHGHGLKILVDNRKKVINMALN